MSMRMSMIMSMHERRETDHLNRLVRFADVMLADKANLILLRCNLVGVLLQEAYVVSNVVENERGHNEHEDDSWHVLHRNSEGLHNQGMRELASEQDDECRKD